MKRIRIYLLMLMLCFAQTGKGVVENASIESMESMESIEPTESIDTAQSTGNGSLLMRVEDWYARNMNYGSITALMAVESSFIPFPSEVVIPPAAYVAETEGSSLNITDSYVLNVLLIVLAGTLGALIGAVINYLLAMWLGRPIVYAFADSRLGHLLLLSSEKIRQAEDYFNAHGKTSTFVGRFIPAIRQLISIPAGLARMPFGSFLLYTALGAFIWNAVLALLGYVAHGQADLIHRYSHELSVVLLGAVSVAAVWFIVKHLIRKKKHA